MFCGYYWIKHNLRKFSASKFLWLRQWSKNYFIKSTSILSITEIIPNSFNLFLGPSSFVSYNNAYLTGSVKETIVYSAYFKQGTFLWMHNCSSSLNEMIVIWFSWQALTINNYEKYFLSITDDAWLSIPKIATCDDILLALSSYAANAF